MSASCVLTTTTGHIPKPVAAKSQSNQHECPRRQTRFPEPTASVGHRSVSRVNIFCNAEKLPRDLFEVRGFHRHSANKKWRIGDQFFDPDALADYLETLSPELQRTGIVIRGTGKADCSDFRQALASLVEFCTRHNVDLFMDIPTGLPWCLISLCGWVDRSVAAHETHARRA